MNDEITDFEVTQAMLVYGGGFVHALGNLIRAADATNKAKAKAAFPELWTRYAEIAKQMKAREGRGVADV